MNQVTRALTPEEIARVEARQQQTEEKAAPAAVAPPQFVSAEGRTVTVDLQFPVTYEGALIDKVIIRRPVMREWRRYLRDCADAVEQNGPGADDLVDQPWVSVPAVVLENLDFTDASRVEAAQEGFFARSPSDPGTETDPQSTSSSGIGEQ